MFRYPWILVTRNIDVAFFPFFIPKVPLEVWRKAWILSAVDSFEHSSLIYNIVDSPLAYAVKVEVLAILILVDGGSLVLLLGWFVLAEILRPLGSSSGGPEGDGARAADGEAVISVIPMSQC